ncbi:MAG: haloacid dehalogenase type II, partial [Bacteroidota bacterium]
MLSSEVKAIVFDAYGTLFDVQSLTQRLQQHFGDQASAINQIWRQKQLQYTWLRALMQRYQPFSQVTMDALSFACEASGQALREAQKQDLLDCYYAISAYQQVQEAIPGLAERFPLAVLSNADEAMLGAALRNAQLERHFTHVLSVDQVQCYKPDPRVYQLAVDAFGLTPQQICFVSSNTWDVAGAKSFGFQVAWLDHHD